MPIYLELMMMLLCTPILTPRALWWQKHPSYPNLKLWQLDQPLFHCRTTAKNHIIFAESAFFQLKQWDQRVLLRYIITYRFAVWCILLLLARRVWNLSIVQHNLILWRIKLEYVDEVESGLALIQRHWYCLYMCLCLWCHARSICSGTSWCILFQHRSARQVRMLQQRNVQRRWRYLINAYLCCVYVPA